MKKITQIFVLSSLAIFALLPLNTTCAGIFSAKQEPLSGFETLDTPVPTSVKSNEIEVAEVFWYGCGHCFHLEKSVKEFRAELPEGVKFVRIPAPLNSFWENHAKIYFIADSLNVADRLHPLVFSEIMQNKNYLEDKIKVADFFKTQGYDRQMILELYDSFGINMAISNARAKVARYKITSVPQIVVDGRYLVNSETAQGTDNIFFVVKKLIEKIQKEKNKNASKK